MSVGVSEDGAVEDVMKLVAPVLSVASVPATLTKPLCLQRPDYRFENFQREKLWQVLSLLALLAQRYKY